jgi:hypothetical protein
MTQWIWKTEAGKNLYKEDFCEDGLMTETRSKKLQ